MRVASGEIEGHYAAHAVPDHHRLGELETLAHPCQVVGEILHRVALAGLVALSVPAQVHGHEAGSRHAWHKAGKEGDPPGYEEDEDERVEGMDPAPEEDVRKWATKVAEVEKPITGALDRVEREMARQALSVWKAFVGFCEEEMALDASKLLSALALPIAERARTLEELAARLEVEPDAENVEGYREIMGQAWRRALAKGAKGG